MNKNNAKDYLPLVQALADGKVIQSRWTENHPWQDRLSPDFTLPISNYRIKPEPRALYAFLFPDGRLWGSTISKAEAEAWCDLGPRRGVVHDGIMRKFVEVVED